MEWLGELEWATITGAFQMQNDSILCVCVRFICALTVYNSLYF